MVNRMQFYIDGAWVDPVVKKSTPVVTPATEEAMYDVALGSKADAAGYAVAAPPAASLALVGTLGPAHGASVVTTFDPAARDNNPQFSSNVVIDNPANAEAAKADAARYPKPVFYRNASEEWEHNLRG